MIVLPEAVREEAMSNLKKISISFFIVVSFLWMSGITLPLVHEALSLFALNERVSFTGHPMKENLYLTAEVEFEDGTSDTLIFPRPSKLSLAEKYFYGEKFRLLQETLANKGNEDLWVDTAKYTLRKLKSSNFHKIPLRVHLFKNFKAIPHPEGSLALSNSTKYIKAKLFTYEVFDER